MKELQAIQNEMKAPKGRRNEFGKYNYRSCEDIYQAVKPLLQKYNCTLMVSDDMVMLGDRFYIKAVATLTDTSGHSVQATAYAREEETKKGMDASQITGTASSYARKCAMCGLFLIDDSNDADALNTSEEYTQGYTHEEMKKAIHEIYQAKTKAELKAVYSTFSKPVQKEINATAKQLGERLP